MPNEALTDTLQQRRSLFDETNGDPDFESAFYILKNTYCAAVLTENGFMDCEVSLAYLESDAGLVGLHVYLQLYVEE